MRLGRRRPFADLVDRQLVLFTGEHGGLLAACGRALDEYRASGRDDAEERYGAYVDAVDEARDALEEMRDTYAGVLDGETANAYRDAFDAAVRRRFPELAGELEEGM
ncbi:MAG: hypothetical protein U0R69_06925 [Gaiellales bacterium]